MAVHWTEEQKQVIRLRERNLLVSAAAGSGKTAVLVERIIRMLTDPCDPVSVDELLVVTFTEAAAAEMKERILKAVEGLLLEHPEDLHLQRQATLVHSAQITTIDKFCLSVIRNYFHVIDLDPGFRIGEDGELKLLKQDVLGEVLEECYTEGTKEFLDMTEQLRGGRDGKDLERMILKVYEYSCSCPQPDVWLDQCVENYDVSLENIEKIPFLDRIMNLTRQYLMDMTELIKEGLDISRQEDGPWVYEEALKADLEMLDRLASAASFREMCGRMAELEWKSLSTKRGKGIAPEKREYVKKLRDKVKDVIEGLQKTYFYDQLEELVSDMAQGGAAAKAFVEVVRRFARAFSEKKRSRNLIDFSDMEHFALQILTEEKDGELVPSRVAKEYQEQFKEVMIDEYQDSNLLQEALLTSVSRVSRGTPNIFMVGDVKQCIYQFRHSRPELFMEKYETYSVEEGSRQRIDLHKNFRSRKEVIESVNFVFSQIMRKELGGIDYDSRSALYLGADYEPASGKEAVTELLLFDVPNRRKKTESDNYRDPSGIQAETRAIAKRIRKLVREGWVQDKTTGKYRRPRYQDILILLRKTKGLVGTVVSILAQEGIPAYTSGSEGYFETYEIRVLLDYLKILDNPRQDLPMTAVLTSPFLGLSAQELAQIRLFCPEEHFYEAVKVFAQSGRDARVTDFYRQFEQFRDRVSFTAIHELLWQIIEETGYGSYVAAMPGGRQRLANVEMLVQKAAAFEETSYKGLFNFVRYIEQLREYEVDYGEANVADEQSDVVRIMSVHKSKGLEFPIIFVAGLGKKMNTQDASDKMVVHSQWGIGADAVDLERRTKIPTILKKVISKENQMDSLGEELRILYVAMTRAKEKLILTGQMESAREAWERIWKEHSERAVMEPGSLPPPLPLYQLTGANCYLDWLLPAAAWPDSPIEVTVLSALDLEAADIVQRQGEWLARDVLENWDAARVYDPVLRTYLEQQWDYGYPYETDRLLKRKFTVSELKKRAYLREDSSQELLEEPDVIPLLPEFLKEDSKTSGAARGTAYHKLLEMLDFSRDYDRESLAKEMERLCREGRFAREMAETVKLEDILDFLNCSIGQRMRAASEHDLLVREQPFVLGVDVQEIYPGTSGEDTILVQGIIDAYFEEEGAFVLLDYKTDQLYRPELFQEKYHAQLEYYAKALEQLLDRPVKQKIIYSFALKKEIKIE